MDFVKDFNDCTQDNLNDTFTTLIIGPNGTGKSQILRVIIDIFRELEYQKYREKKIDITRCGYELEYMLDNAVYSIISHGKSKKILKKNWEVIDISKLILPEKLLASSFMLNDRFYFNNKPDNPKKLFYEYLGIRRTSGSAGTKTYLKKVVESVINALDDPLFVYNLKSTIEFLELEPFFNVKFKFRFRTYLFKKKLSKQEFVSFFKDWKKRRKTKPFSIAYFDKLSEQEIKELVFFINHCQKRITNSKTAYFLEYDLLSQNIKSNEKTIKEFHFIKKLMQLDILSHPNIEIKKKKEIFDLEGGSSGEYHLISTIIGILSKIKENSLVLIDEPEISFHPNWQMKYVDYLKEIFTKYGSCHFIIATHSHFMISDLKQESSSIVSLKRNSENEIEAYLHPESTYGWTAEDILYSVFEVPTVRNYYLADKIGDILSLVAQPEQNLIEIKKRVDELKKVHLELKDVDPLKEVIGKLIEKFG